MEKTPIPFSQRKYDILFSGTYYRPEMKRREIDERFEKDSVINRFYHIMADYMLQNSRIPVEQAALGIMHQMKLSLPDEQVRTIFRCSEPLDWMVRMHHRGRVVSVLAEARFDLWLLGRGWEHHPTSTLPNVHVISDRIPFAQTLPYMADAKINLNVMPWFKAGTHDRIFNILLQKSLLLTDASDWIADHFTDGKDIALYDLDNLDALPQVQRYLQDINSTEQIIDAGFEAVKSSFTWKQCADTILQRCVNDRQ